MELIKKVKEISETFIFRKKCVPKSSNIYFINIFVFIFFCPNYQDEPIVIPTGKPHHVDWRHICRLRDQGHCREFLNYFYGLFNKSECSVNIYFYTLSPKCLGDEF